MALPTDTELVETLGEGSFGTVYVARVKEGAIQRTVVLKVLKASWANNADIMSRSKDEAALLARLNHDNIVKVEQLTSLQGRPAVVMEYVRGLTLDVIIKKHGAIPVGVALQIIARVASALDAAFNKVPPGLEAPLRVVHRDIKPSNIILSINGAVKVLDFGTARGEFGEREAETRSVTLGSPRYMAPERFDGVNSGSAIDMYALGVTFYELLSGRSMGRMPLNPERHKEKVQSALEALRPKKKGGGKDLDLLLALLGECLAYEPENRVTASEFRKRALNILSQLSGATITLDIFSETVVEPIWEKREQLAFVPLGSPDGGLLSETGSSASFVSRSHASQRSSLSGHSAASSLVVAAGGGRKVMVLLGGGLVVALGGILLLKHFVDTEPDPSPTPTVQTQKNNNPATVQSADETKKEDQQLSKTDGDAQEKETKEETPSSAVEDTLETSTQAPEETLGTTKTVAAPAAGPTTPVTIYAVPGRGTTLTINGNTYKKFPAKVALPIGRHSSHVEFSNGVAYDCRVQIKSDSKNITFKRSTKSCR